MYGDTPTPAPKARAPNVTKKNGLMERLRVRHEAALEKFKQTAAAANREADAEQVQLLAELKRELRRSHAETAALLASEEERLAAEEARQQRYAARFPPANPPPPPPPPTRSPDGDGSAETDGDDGAEAEAEAVHYVKDGDVLPMYEDRFFTGDGVFVAADFVTCAAAAKAAMLRERARLLQVAVRLRQQYHSRTVTLHEQQARVEAVEARRRGAMQDSLRDLMLSLAKISYCSVTVSHVLAQRALHGANEQVALNYVGTQTLFAQLGQREVLKQRQYSVAVGALLTRARTAMVDSTLLWARTVLQSAAVRRPADRVESVERVWGVSASGRRDGAGLLAGLLAMLQSLRRTSDDGIVEAKSAEETAAAEAAADTLAVPPRVECGGVGSAGWLRQYSADPFQDPFPTGSDDVVDEWRMKVNVVLRNVQAACLETAAHVRALEAQRQATIQEICATVPDILRWLHQPQEDERAVVLEASLLGRDGGEVDAPLVPFGEGDPASAEAALAGSERALERVVRAARAEGEWFAATVESGLADSFSSFEQLLALAFDSVLRWFERSTQELVSTARGALCPVRRFYVGRYEQRRDCDDDLARREAAYTEVCARLSQSCSAGAAEELFAEALRHLEGIAAVYTRHQKRTVEGVRAALVDVTAASAASSDALLNKLGLESVERTEARLEADRRAKMEAALAELLREQRGEAAGETKGGNGGKRRGNQREAPPPAVVIDPDAASQQQEALTLSLLSADFPHEVADYPQVHADCGVTFNIIGPLTILGDDAPPPPPPPPAAETATTTATTTPRPPPRGLKDGARGGGAGGRSFRRPPATAAQPSAGHSAPAVVVLAPPAECVAAYSPMLASTILSPGENFLSPGDVGAWRESLRCALLNWALALQRSVDDGMRSYCERAQAEAERQTAELLRRHRRRPAALQADVFEAHLRDLEGTENTSERLVQRIRERLEKLTVLWEAFKADPQRAADEAKALADVERYERQAAAAASLSALQSQDRHHAAACDGYTGGYGRASEALLLSIDGAKASLAAECSRLLEDRARVLATSDRGEGVSVEQALEEDTAAAHMRAVLAELEATAAAIHAEADEAMAARRATADAARQRYAAAFARNAAELQLMARVKEAFSWLKTQLHAFQVTSTAAEEDLNELVGALEEELAKGLPPAALCNMAQALLHMDTSAAPAPAEEGLGAAVLEQLLAGLRHALDEERVAMQRETRGCSLARVFDVLGRLRGQLFARGVRLSSLTHTVELVRVLPEYAIEPQVLARDPAGAGAAPSTGRGAAGQGRRARSNSPGLTTKASAQAPLLPLPATTPVAEQFTAWATRTRETVQRLLTEHFAAHPPPLTRRLPGVEEVAVSTKGSATAGPGAGEAAAPIDAATATEEALQAVDDMCHAQRERLTEMVDEARKPYYGQVRRVAEALRVMPRYASAALYGLTAAALGGRLRQVLGCYADLHRRSVALRESHRRAVRVSVGLKANHAALERVAPQEADRQRLMDHATLVFWGLALREVQDEADQHAARCFTATTTLFHLLRGIVTPGHLVPYEWEGHVGPHRGLRLLLHQRAVQRAEAAEARVADEPEAAPGSRRERRQQPQDAAATTKHPQQPQDGAPGAALAPLAQLLPATVFGGLPVFRVRPLEAFNAEHPAVAVAPLESVRGCFPGLEVAEGAGAAAAGGAGGQQSGSGRRAMAAAASKRKSVDAASAAAAEGNLLVTPSISGQATRLHKDVMTAVRQLVDLVSGEATSISHDVDGSFQTIANQESSWQRSWRRLVESVCAEGGIPSSSLLANDASHSGGSSNGAATNPTRATRT